MRILIVEAASGLAGDMFVAAAARLARCEDEVVALPAKLGLPGVRCVFRDVVRSSLSCRKFDVEEALRPAARPALVYPTGGDAAPAHEHRPLSEIRARILSADLGPGVTARALRMFDRLGAVEAAAHGIPVEQVHFHEVGAVDSILDICAAALCLERLGVAAAYASPVVVGSGTVRTAHGLLPVPAPATERLLQGMPTVPGDLAGEWTTPTGALILGELGVRFTEPVSVTRDSAFGAGTRDPRDRPNVVRLRLADTLESPAPPADGLERDELVALFCNLDDQPGELLGADFVEMLLAAGARDVVVHPVVMKKGRPAQQLEVLVEAGAAEAMALHLLAHTSTIGVRLLPVRRLKLPREAVVLATPFGEVAAKRVRLPDGSTRTTPEYEACRALAARAGAPVQTVYGAALASARA